MAGPAPRDNGLHDIIAKAREDLGRVQCSRDAGDSRRAGDLPR